MHHDNFHNLMSFGIIIYRAFIVLRTIVIDIISTLTLLLSEEFSFMIVFESSAISIVGLKHCIHFV